MICKLKYGNTNTFFIKGTKGGILIDTDYAGTLQGFFGAIKRQNIGLNDITYIIATHYHPDHIGIVSELMDYGLKLLAADCQTEYIHYSDHIFQRDPRLKYMPIDEKEITIIGCGESRGFLSALGIDGEIISTPSHSPDSISVILDSGDCFVGDLEPIEYLDAYESNEPLKNDWDKIMKYSPKRIYYAHANEKIFE